MGGQSLKILNESDGWPITQYSTFFNNNLRSWGQTASLMLYLKPNGDYVEA